jgi:hypothetical protein
MKRCLDKDRKRRLTQIADAGVWIDDVLANPTPAGGLGPDALAPDQRWWWTGWALAAIAAAALAVVTFRYSTPIDTTELRVQVNTPPSSDATSLAISPDGRRLVFPVSHEGRTQLWLRPLDSLTETPLPGTDGATFPFWSPNSASVGFFADGQLKRVDAVGGVPVVLVRAPLGRGGAWNNNGIIVYAPAGTGPLYKVPATGGEPVAVSQVESGHMSHRFPQFLPDGEHFVFFAAGTSPGLYVGSLAGGPAKRIVNTEASGVVAASGFLLFLRQGALFAQRLDLKKLELRDQPIPVAEQVAVDSGAFLGGFKAGSNVVAYRTGGAGGRRQLLWFDRAGKAIETPSHDSRLTHRSTRGSTGPRTAFKSCSVPTSRAHTTCIRDRPTAEGSIGCCSRLTRPKFHRTSRRTDAFSCLRVSTHRVVSTSGQCRSQAARPLRYS